MRLFASRFHTRLYDTRTIIIFICNIFFTLFRGALHSICVDNLQRLRTAFPSYVHMFEKIYFSKMHNFLCSQCFNLHTRILAVIIVMYYI